MIYLLVGNKKDRKDAIQHICQQQGITTDQIQHIYQESFKEVNFEDMVSQHTGLFNERECFVVHDAIRDLKIGTILKKYSDTEHILIFSEDSVLKKDLTTFKKNEFSIKEFQKEQKNEIERYNTFALADILGKRDRKKLWLLFREAIEHVSAEEIHGILFWQMKNLALVKNSQTNPGMNPFVYKKNQGFIQNYSSEEIKNMSVELTKMFHTRDTYSTLEIDLEKFILSL